MNYFTRYQNVMGDALASTEVSGTGADGLDCAGGIEAWVALSQTVKAGGGYHYLVGNGASAMMASHMSVDCTKNAELPALAFNDAAYLTAIGNDLGYENAFAFPLSRYGRRGDLLITISSSGNSPNILKAIDVAREQEMKVVTLSGMRQDNQSRTRGDLNFYVSARTYGVVECTHQILLHCWLDCYMGIEEWNPDTRI